MEAVKFRSVLMIYLGWFDLKRSLDWILCEGDQSGGGNNFSNIGCKNSVLWRVRGGPCHALNFEQANRER